MMTSQVTWSNPVCTTSGLEDVLRTSWFGKRSENVMIWIERLENVWRTFKIGMESKFFVGMSRRIENVDEKTFLERFQNVLMGMHVWQTFGKRLETFYKLRGISVEKCCKSGKRSTDVLQTSRFPDVLKTWLKRALRTSGRREKDVHRSWGCQELEVCADLINTWNEDVFWTSESR